MKIDRIQKFTGDQLSRWELACKNFRALKNVRLKEAEVGGLKVKLQFNPARMISSAAKLSKEDILNRKCFLCRENRPAEQIMMKFEGRKGKKYDILLNPYPIFQNHLVIAQSKHTDQSIERRFVDILDLAKKYSNYTFFYNGPKSGASAPDHHHFQAAPKGEFPLENDILENRSPLNYICSIQDAELFHYQKFTKGVFVIESDTVKSAAKLFYRLLDCADVIKGETEPRFNLFAIHHEGKYRATVVFRSQHRSHHYFSEGEDHLTMSPGCADMGGVFIVPVEEEFNKIDNELLNEMVEEVSISSTLESRIIERLTRTQRNVEVGIITGHEIEFEIVSDGAGRQKATYKEGKIEYDGTLWDELYFGSRTPSTMFAETSFIIYNVTIGINFHWQRNEAQKFAGALKIIAKDGQLTAINVLGVEDYLLSVISSEMSATSSEEFLKAHAVISRSWLISQIENRIEKKKNALPAHINNLPELVTYLQTILVKEPDEANDIIEYTKWYDNHDHKNFDVCADDHCQRYQGLNRATGKTIRNAIDQTWGEVLTYNGELCDARFSKCCGGKSETFDTCWDDSPHPYLQTLPDSPRHSATEEAFCDCKDETILKEVLNNYDIESPDFYKWTQSYSTAEISEFILKKSGIDIGELLQISPLERGESGRIKKIEIKGSKKTLIIGKELEIRRLLSESHLKSSAFKVEIKDGKVKFEGSGWGHGVGLCQIGAAVMAAEGYSYKEILQHYYPGTNIEIKH